MYLLSLANLLETSSLLDYLPLFFLKQILADLANSFRASLPSFTGLISSKT